MATLPSNMAANTNHTTLLKNQSAIKYLPVSSQIFGISKIPTHRLKETLVMLKILLY